MNNSLNFSWKCPSNIALVKYWGKHGNQLPLNASVSFTLDNCHTETQLEAIPKTTLGLEIEVYLDGILAENFKKKIIVFFEKILDEFPFLNAYKFIIKTKNSFPHSSGIASSASGFGALALCLCQMKYALEEKKIDDDAFKNEASRIARIGSGSASRSIYGGIVSWGKHPKIANSSDEFAIPLTDNIHPVYQSFNDTILLIHKGEKTVSSTIGHQLMNNHPFAKQRIDEAQNNMSKILDIFKTDDVFAFGKLLEQEALMLHAMMMTSDPYFILMKAETVKAIEKIWEYRNDTKTPVFFTLDAGANVHVLFPKKVENEVDLFIKNELSVYCENKQYICDQIGKGSIIVS